LLGPFDDGRKMDLRDFDAIRPARQQAWRQFGLQVIRHGANSMHQG